jgi:chemotaxis protein methyltransferase CheR
MSANAEPANPPEDLFDIEARLLIDAVYLRYCQDFRAYAPSSLRRRLAQARDDLGCASLSELQDRVLRDPQVWTRLLDYLTVQYSDLFRDPSYFLVLRRQVLPVLATYPSPRIWVAGCSTGEELYSIAIALAEEGLLDRTIVYATDINPTALRQAEQGIFPLDRIPGFSANYLQAGGRRSLSDYYTAGYGAALFDKRLRERVVFADHSLATDGVFAEVQLVSCRNVLIYFNRELQDRALGLFADALVRLGFLGLGSRETVAFSGHRERYQELYGDERIYQRQ